MMLGNGLPVQPQYLQQNAFIPGTFENQNFMAALHLSQQFASQNGMQQAFPPVRLAGTNIYVNTPPGLNMQSQNSQGGFNQPINEQ
ncbi:hypothetical protein HK096_010706 [Nowakowskiella sp. JEL0078]|nr:hypothetical protein HK096_010706 [Nowakowskiella sp. JEL0078]